MTRYEAAVELIREININLETASAQMDTETDHRALAQASQRYERAIPQQRQSSDE